MKIFKAKTHEAYVLKTLSELLQNNIRTACFEVDEKGISLCMMDNHKPSRTLIDLELFCDNFSLYKFRMNKKKNVGLNLGHFHRMLKSIKKKDSMYFFIDGKSPTEFGIGVIPKENNRKTTSFVTIQNIQNLDIDVPKGYDKPVIVPSNEFQKMCKELNNIGSVVKITAKQFFIRFESNAASIYSRKVEFGELDDDDDDDIKNADQPFTYCEEFDTEQLVRITKMAGLSSNMQIYPKTGLPLMFRSPVGSLGRINVYVKSHSEIENERARMNFDNEL